jgi:rod shape-determining protein MreD
MKVAIRVVLVLLSAAILQRGVLAQLRIDGAAADVFLLLAIAGGIVTGPDRGAIVGFASGLTLDLLVQTPLGLSALTYCLVGFVAGRLQGNVRRANRWFPSLLAALLGIGGVALYAAIGEVLGQSTSLSSRLIAVMAVVAVTNAVFIRLALRVVRWAWPDESSVSPVLR